MIEILKSSISDLKSDFCDVRFEEIHGTSIVISNEGIEEIAYRDSKGGIVRVLDNGGMAYSSFNLIDDLKNAIISAQKSAKLLSTKSKIDITRYQAIKDKVITKYEIDPLSLSLDEKLKICNEYMNILKAKDIQSARVRYLDYRKKKYYVNSEGSEIELEFTYVGISFVAYAVSGTNVQKAAESIALYKGFEAVSNLHSKAEEVAKRAVDLLLAEQVVGGRYNVIIDPKLTGVFAHEAFGHLSEADHIYGNQRLMETMKIGRRFGVEELNIIDDGNIEDVVGYTPYDDEGIPAQRTYLVKNGVLNARLHSRLTSKFMNEPLSGNARALSYEFPPLVRMTNTFIDNGTTPVEELFEKLGNGIYVVDFLGGQTNLEMFTFSAAYGYKVENGKITKLLRDITLTGNVFETLNNIVAIGNDLKIHSTMGGCGKGGQSPLPVGDGGPHILVKDVLIGGRVG
jgi:TldD protein